MTKFTQTQHLFLFTIWYEIIQKCPEKAWQLKGSDVNPSCASVKTWFGKCGKDINAIKKIMENNSAKE
jgi:hypothetical protein